MCVKLVAFASPHVRGVPVHARRLVHFVGSYVIVAQKEIVARIE